MGEVMAEWLLGLMVRTVSGHNESITFSPQHANPNILENSSQGLKEHFKLALFVFSSHTSWKNI